MCSHVPGNQPVNGASSALPDACAADGAAIRFGRWPKCGNEKGELEVRGGVGGGGLSANLKDAGISGSGGLREETGEYVRREKILRDVGKNDVCLLIK